VKSVIDKLAKKGKGIILMHDIQPTTAKAVPMLLAALKDNGYKVVQMKPKGELKTLPEFDTAIEASVKGLGAPGAERPTSSVIRTISGESQSKLGGEPPQAVTQAPAAPLVPSQPSAGNPGVPVEARAVVAQPLSAGESSSPPPAKKWFWQN
jgi:hypothetical protein